MMLKKTLWTFIGISIITYAYNFFKFSQYREGLIHGLAWFGL